MKNLAFFTLLKDRWISGIAIALPAAWLLNRAADIFYPSNIENWAYILSVKILAKVVFLSILNLSLQTVVDIRKSMNILRDDKGNPASTVMNAIQISSIFLIPFYLFIDIRDAFERTFDFLLGGPFRHIFYGHALILVITGLAFFLLLYSFLWLTGCVKEMCQVVLHKLDILHMNHIRVCAVVFSFIIRILLFSGLIYVVSFMVKPNLSFDDFLLRLSVCENLLLVIAGTVVIISSVNKRLYVPEEKW